MEVRVKVVPKKSKQGTYIQSVREHYLRDDIGCQSLACKLCSERDPAEPFLPLSTPVASQTLSATAPHYLIPDAQTLLRFLEIFEAPIITDVIILQTVFAEVDAATNLRTVNRIRFAHHASLFFSLSYLLCLMIELSFVILVVELYCFATNTRSTHLLNNKNENQKLREQKEVLKRSCGFYYYYFSLFS